MTKTASRFKKRVGRKILKMVDAYLTACGHEDLVDVAENLRAEVMVDIEFEIDRLARKAGEP